MGRCLHVWRAERRRSGLAAGQDAGDLRLGHAGGHAGRYRGYELQAVVPGIDDVDAPRSDVAEVQPGLDPVTPEALAEGRQVTDADGGVGPDMGPVVRDEGDVQLG